MFLKEIVLINSKCTFRWLSNIVPKTEYDASKLLTENKNLRSC